MPETSRVSQALIRVAGGTALSRILGFIRDLLSAAAFGAGPLWDAFLIAFTLPNVFRRILGEGAFSSAFIPLFSKEKEKNGDSAAAYWAAGVLGRCISLLIVIAGVGVVVLEIIALVADSEKWQTIASLGAFLFPLVIPVCAVAGMGALLNAYKVFTQPALVSSVINLFWIVAAGAVLLFNPSLEQGARWLCWALLGAGMVQYALHWSRLRTMGCVIMPRWGMNDGARAVVSKMIPALLGLGAIQINTIFDRIIASIWAPDGAVSVLFYANRIMQFPLALIGIAVATASFPFMADAASKNKRNELNQHLSKGQLWVLAGGVPALFIGILFSDLIVEVAFERGAFGVAEGDRTQAVLIAYMGGLLFFCALHPLIKAFHSLGDMATPAKIGGLMVGVNLSLNLILVHPYQEVGLALSTSLCGVISFIWHLVALRRQESIRGMPHLYTALKVVALGGLASGLIWVLKYKITTVFFTELKSSSTLVDFALLCVLQLIVGIGYILCMRRVLHD